jgi:hypothetical protein
MNLIKMITQINIKAKYLQIKMIIFKLIKMIINKMMNLNFQIILMNLLIWEMSNKKVIMMILLKLVI